jgi:hypothetical protein
MSHCWAHNVLSKLCEKVIIGSLPDRPCHSRRLPTTVARVRAQVRSCGICGGQSDTRAGFLRVLHFPLPVLIPPTVPHSSSSSIIRDWYNRPFSGRRTKWTQSHPTQMENKLVSQMGFEPCINQITLTSQPFRLHSN